MMNLLDHPRIMLIVFVGIIVAIPSLAFLIKTRTSFKSSASQNYTQAVTEEATGSAKEVPKDLPQDISAEDDESSGSTDEGLGAKVTFGPTMKFQIIIQGRPAGKQGVKKLFVGLATGSPTTNPQYLLTFEVPVPDTGIYEGMSLAGLTIGNTYTAYLKAPAQIATSSAFVVRPNVTDLNSGLPLKLLSGDLNEDNAVNASDVTIAKSYLGKITSSVGWNENIDLNLDGRVNTIDLAIILSNINRTGAGDLYISRIASGSAEIATESGQLTPPTQGGSSSGGYWMWVPSF